MSVWSRTKYVTFFEEKKEAETVISFISAIIFPISFLLAFVYSLISFIGFIHSVANRCVIFPRDFIGAGVGVFISHLWMCDVH